MKKKTKVAIIITILVLASVGCTITGIMIWKNKRDVPKETLGKNQSYVYGQIESIAGNDMKLALAEEVTEERTNRKWGNFESRPNKDSDSKGSQGFFDPSQMQGGEAPDGQMPGGQMPGGQMPEGQMPEGQMPGGQRPGDNSSSNSKDSDSSKDSTTVTTYKLTGEKAEYMIPVKTSVTTQLGAVTTFSRLATGDYVKLLLDKDENGNDIIVQIWIVG